jgi:predicted acylesterase/phospholipase RssA
MTTDPAQDARHFTQDQYRLPEAKLGKSRECYRVLSLSGGGYRGLFTARLLARIEASDLLAGEPIGTRFDMIAGTSVGGFIAVALALEVKAQTIYEQLLEWGPGIFPRLFLKAGRKVFSKVVYRAEPLDMAINACFGKSAATRLSSLKKPLMLTAVSWSRGELRLLRSAGLARGEADTCTLLDATRATSAAPAHFPAVKIDMDWCVDGGLVANCPDFHALFEARRQGLPVRMLSVGTAGITRESVPSKIPLRGLTWAKPALDLGIQAQEHLAQAACRRELGDSYLHLNKRPGVDQEKLKNLDCADDDTTIALTNLADSRFKELQDDSMDRQKLDWIISSVRV